MPGHVFYRGRRERQARDGYFATECTMADDRECGVKLCDALMKVLGAGKHELPAIVEGLNQSDVAPASGTADQLCEELHRQARPPEKKTYSPVAQPRNEQGNGSGKIAKI